MRHFTFLIASAGLAGCTSSSEMQFSVLSRPDAEIPANVLIAEKVHGSHCPDKGSYYGSYAEAINAALATAPGANALAKVEFRVVSKAGKICVEVNGDAVRL